MRNKFLALAGLAALSVVLSPSAHATLLCLPVLAPGGVSFPQVDDTCAADHNGTNPIGTKIDDTGVQAFSFTAGSGSTALTTKGSIEEVVYREAGGTLDFYIQLSVTGNPGGFVDVTSTGNFTSFLTEVGTVSPIHILGPGNVEPLIDTRSAPGDTIRWTYLSAVTPGLNSFTMAISTNAILAAPGSIGVIGANGGTQTVAGFEPISAVPEPVSIILLGTALALSALFIRRRHASRV